MPLGCEEVQAKHPAGGLVGSSLYSTTPPLAKRECDGDAPGDDDGRAPAAGTPEEGLVHAAVTTSMRTSAALIGQVTVVLDLPFEPYLV